MNFKMVGLFIIFLTCVIGASLNNAFAASKGLRFLTEDNHHCTQLCLAAVTNNVANTKHQYTRAPASEFKLKS